MNWLKQGKSRKPLRQFTHPHKQDMLAEYKGFSQPIRNHIVRPAVIHCDLPSIFYTFSELMYASANVFAVWFIGGVFKPRK